MAIGLIAGTAACDTDVVNPGPIESTFLNDSSAQIAITSGVARATGDALNWIAYTIAPVAREVHPSGSTGSFGITPEQQEGILQKDQVNVHWENAHRARFLAADGIRRITEVLDPAVVDDENLAELYLWAGYNSRLMGEVLCQAVIPELGEDPGDPGEPGVPEDSDAHLLQAIEYFNQAESISSDPEIQMAAKAGRASANAFLGNWGEAVADAEDFTDDEWSFSMPYFDIGDDDQSNRIYVAGKALPYKAHSQIFTWIAEYNPADAGAGDDNPLVADEDPRVPWRISGENGDAASACCGIIEWWPQTKHDSDDAPIELSSYQEMQLILAEDEIVNNGDYDAGMAIVNGLRADAGVPVETSAANGDDTGFTETEALTYFMREHAIEMWLEGRRLPAMRRWEEALGEATLESLLQPLERVGDQNTSTTSHLSTRDYCIPLSESEEDTNPNISG